MKKLILHLFTFLLVSFSATTAFASPGSNVEVTDYFQPCEKTYVLPEQLGMTPRGIYVKFDNHWFKTEALHSDSEGIYIQNLSPQADGCRDGYVPCRNCDRCVLEIYDICPFCKKPV
jgi:hypothetical protein